MSVFWASEEFLHCFRWPLAVLQLVWPKQQRKDVILHLDTRWKLLGGVLKPKKARGGFESSRLTSGLALTDKMI